MINKIGNITFDCSDPRRLAEFWSAVMGYQVNESNEHFAEVSAADGSRPHRLFIKVPEAKSAKNRMHMDLGSDDMQAKVNRLVELGARRGEEHDEWGVNWTVMYDPEGNEFCVAKEQG